MFSYSAVLDWLLSVMAKPSLRFRSSAVCCLIWAIVGFGVGQVRTLARYGWLANLAIWMNLMIMFISMGVIAYCPPNYAISVLGSAGGAVDPNTITPDSTGNYPHTIMACQVLPSLLSNQRIITRGLCVWWCPAFYWVHGRNETALRLRQSDVGCSILYMYLLYGLRMLRILLPGTVRASSAFWGKIWTEPIFADTPTKLPTKAWVLIPGKQ